MSNGVTYVCVDEEGYQIEQGMARTLNISQGGMLLETPRPIESNYILIVTIDLEGNVIEIRGKVIYSTGVASGWFHTGIRFLEPYDRQREVIVKFIRAYHYRKEQAKSKERKP